MLKATMSVTNATNVYTQRLSNGVIETNLIHWENALFHGLFFEVCPISCKIHGEGLKNSWKFHGP